jgi:hypothetical protein
MKYSQLCVQLYKESTAVLKRYCQFFLGLSALYHLYQYLIFKFVKIDGTQLVNSMSAYHVLIYPSIILIVIYLVDRFNSKKGPQDFAKLMMDGKRCYFRILLIYLAVELVRRYFGFGTGLLVFFVMYTKLPFLEQEIFFKNSSLWQALKNSNELTNRPEIVKSITILVLVFILAYLAIQKITNLTLSSDLIYKQAILASISVIEFTFFLFCKAVLTKIYTRIAVI